MNFHNEQPFDVQLANLLAMLIMFEKKIEETRKKLSGNEQFHSRLIFSRMDIHKNGEIGPEDIVVSISPQNRTLSLPECQRVCRKYTVSGAFTYQELLALIVPKNDKSLAQRVLIRTAKRGAVIPDYLWRYFCDMFLSVISMTNITEAIRAEIQRSSDNLNHLQMVYFFRRALRTPQSVHLFCNTNAEQGVEYNFNVDDVKYLSNNVRSGNPIRQFTDEDVKELICPLDMNFQKTSKEMAPYYENIRYEKEKTMNGAFYTQTKVEQENRNKANVNFLNSNYRSMYPGTRAKKQTFESRTIGQDKQIPIRQKRESFNTKVINNGVISHDHMLIQPGRMAGGYYLDNFIKDNNSNSLSQRRDQPFMPNQMEGLVVNYSDRPALQLDRFLSGKYPRQESYQKFEDHLPEVDSSVSNSAFVQY